MHSTAVSPTTPSTSRVRGAAVALGATAAHVLVMTPAYLRTEDFRVSELIGLVAVSAAVSLAVFLLAVPGGGPRTATVLAVLSALTLPVFWALLTVPLAVAALVVARRAGARAATWVAAAALVLLVVAVALNS